MSSAENDTHTGRLIWLPESWRIYGGNLEMAQDAYDAAPADPAEVVANALREFDGNLLRSQAFAVLAALGVKAP